MKHDTVSKFGLFSSILCLVHCALVPLLSTIMPFFGVGAGERYIEVCFWLLCLVVLILHILKASGAFRYCLLSIAIIGTAGLLTHQHVLLDCGFYGVALGMCYDLLTKRFSGVCG